MAADSEAVVHSGWLYMSASTGGSLDSWKKQWFVLTEESFSAYKSDPSKGTDVPALLNFARSRFVTAAKSVTDKKFSFKLELKGVTEAEANSTVLFYGSSVIDRDIWVCFLKGEKLDLENCKGFQLRILRGKNVASRDSNGFSDPFCVIHHPETGKSEKTSVQKKTLSPEWNESFPIYISDPSKSPTILIEMWDKDRVGKDYMGEVHVSLPKTRDAEEETWLDLQARAKCKEPVTGQLLLQIVRDPSLTGPSK